MKLHYLKLFSAFRGLPSGFKIYFKQSDFSDVEVEPICLVGLNGSGKSNVLEVISEIFYYLETYHLSEVSNLKSFQTPFGFEIEYSIPKSSFDMARVDWEELRLSTETAQEYYRINIVKKAGEYPEIKAHTQDGWLLCKNKDNNRNAGGLPSRIVGYSSGMNELISNPFIKIDFHYLDIFQKLTGESKSSDIEVNRMFFMDYDSNKLVTLANFLFDIDGFDKSQYEKGTDLIDFGAKDLRHLKKELGVKSISSFSMMFHFRDSNNRPIELPAELNIAVSKLIKCATTHDVSYWEEEGKEKFKSVKLFFWVNRSTQSVFRHHFGRAFELFRALYLFKLCNNYLIGQRTRDQIKDAKFGINISAKLPRYEDSKQVFTINDMAFYKKGVKKPVYYRQLSDGEHQFLHIIGTVLLMDSPGTLFILDEPETHFNPEWRSQFIYQINNCFTAEKCVQEFILTSHSPFIVSDCKPQNVYSFLRDKKSQKVKYKKPDFNTFGASVDLLTKEIFLKDNTISKMGVIKIESIKSMPLETLEDIENAKQASRVLGESVEKVLLFRELILKENELKRND